MRAERRSGREPDWGQAAARTRAEARHPHHEVPPPEHGVVAVFPSAADAERAAEVVKGRLPRARVRIGDDRNHMSALHAEMAEEDAHAVAGPGLGLYTREQATGALWGALIWAPVVAVLALPFAFIPMGGLSLAARLVMMAVIGAAAGGTFGFVAGGGAGAKGPATPMAAEVGVSLAVDVPDEDAETVAEVLAGTGPIRVDQFHDGRPDRTIDLTEDETDER